MSMFFCFSHQLSLACEINCSSPDLFAELLAMANARHTVFSWKKGEKRWFPETDLYQMPKKSKMLQGSLRLYSHPRFGVGSDFGRGALRGSLRGDAGGTLLPQALGPQQKTHARRGARGMRAECARNARGMHAAGRGWLGAVRLVCLAVQLLDVCLAVRRIEALWSKIPRGSVWKTAGDVCGNGEG